MRGDGSIIPLRDGNGRIRKGVWRVRASFGRDPVTGRRRQVERIVRGTKRDAQRVCDDLIGAQDSGLLPYGDQLTFGHFAADCLRRRKDAGELSERTLAESEYFVAYLDKLLGHIPLRDISAYTVETAYQAIREDKRRPDGSTITNRTLRKYHVYLHAILKKAVSFDLIASNPCDKVTPPKMERPNRHSLDTGRAQALALALANAEKSAMGINDPSRRLELLGRLCGVRIAMTTGMRLGEIAGLTWRHIDLQRHTIHVCQARTKYNTTKKPKSEAGDRVISIDPGTSARLARWQAVQADCLRALGISATALLPVVCKPSGDYVSLSTFEHWWERWREEAGFPGLKLHELRHTHATLLLANGIDPKTAQARLGHSSVVVTLDCYAHQLAEADIIAASIIGGLFDCDTKKNTVGALRTAR